MCWATAKPRAGMRSDLGELLEMTCFVLSYEQGFRGCFPSQVRALLSHADEFICVGSQHGDCWEVRGSAPEMAHGT